MNTLTRICADKRDHVASAKAALPLHDLRARLEEASPTRGFINALSAPATAIIAEVKKASPSKGVIRADFNAPAIARIYQDNGAACLSVLTDEPYFQGHDDYFRAVRAESSLPMLRKDFMVDEYQIYESRLLGADCILLIMAALDNAQAAGFYALATSLGMDTLFEVHDEDELDRALALSPAMVGVNNRNLKTLEVDLATGLRLGASMPPGIKRVAESGIATSAEIALFKQAGFDAFLIGESLMREDDIGAALKKILRAN